MRGTDWIANCVHARQAGDAGRHAQKQSAVSQHFIAFSHASILVWKARESSFSADEFLNVLACSS